MPALDIQQTIDEYFERIRRAALALTGNPWDADDLAQETFLVLSRQADRFAGKSSVYTWLYGILLNLDRRERRRYGVQKRKLQVLWDESTTETQTAPSAAAPVEVAEWKRGLWGLVAKLPDGQRQALALRFSGGLRYDEIAEAMQCPLGTVKSRIFNGLAALKRLMEEAGHDMRQAPEHLTEDVSHAV